MIQILFYFDLEQHTVSKWSLGRVSCEQEQMTDKRLVGAGEEEKPG